MIFYAITDRHLHPEGSVLDQASALIRGGVDWLQIREKDLADSALLDAVRILSLEARRLGVKLLVNGRPDVALLGGAHGVHLPAEGLPLAEVRRLCPPPFMIATSCHSLRQVRAAAADGADAAVLGPIFETPSKAPYGKPLGLQALRKACAACTIPVLAIGGIGEGECGEILRAGAAGVAAIRLFCGMVNPVSEVPSLRDRLGLPNRRVEGV